MGSSIEECFNERGCNKNANVMLSKGWVTRTQLSATLQATIKYAITNAKHGDYLQRNVGEGTSDGGLRSDSALP
jgi:hypothetical protein